MREKHCGTGRRPAVATAWLMIPLAALFLLTVSTSLAQPVFVTPDGTAGLPQGGTSVSFPWMIVKHDAGNYTPQASLQTEAPPGIAIDAAWEIYTNQWIISVAGPTTHNGVTYQQSDLISWNTNTDMLLLERAAVTIGVPEGSNLDAVFRDPQTDDLVLSFDIPTTVGSDTVQPADLVRYDFDNNTFMGLFFDASGHGIPDAANLTAAQVRGELTVFALDITVTIGGNTYGPGDLLSWDGGTAIAPFQTLASWPDESRINALSFLGAPGFVPPTISVEKVNATTLRIQYDSTSCSGLEDHGIYQGSLSSLGSGSYDHTAIDCVDGGTQLQEDIPMGTGSVYFIVVPNSQVEEGSYGTDSSGTQRPVGSSACESIQNLSNC